MKLFYYCIYLYLLLKPYYIFKSGSMQPADFFLILAFVLLLIIKDKKKIKELFYDNKKFLLFVILASAINIIYYLTYYNPKFLLSSLYLIFNFFGIIVFSYAFFEGKINNNINKIIKINIIIQLFIYLLHLGRYYGYLRYMGTFNDPNQFGYFIFISYMFIYLFSKMNCSKKGNLVLFIVSLFLIVESASTGMFLGISCFLLLYLIDLVKKLVINFNKYKYKFLMFILIIIPLSFTFIFLNNEFKIFNNGNLIIINRVKEKIERAESTNTKQISIIQERGYDRFIYYPKYILYGSGEGEYNRFKLTYHQDEIHATFPSILFYYGLIPFLILMLWIKEKVIPSKIELIIPLIAIFLESFTLLNQRQVLFWVLIILIYYINKKGCTG